MSSSITPHARNTPLSPSRMDVDLKRSKYPVQDTQDGDSPKRPLEVTPVETTKQCNTPGCTYREFHIGPHSNDIPGCKRARKTVEPFVATPATRGTDAHGLGTYDSVCKSGQRAMFTAVAMQQKCTALRPAVYLDGPDAALTKSLLDAGCDPKALMPINNSAPTAEQIERECPSVRCVVDDICRLAALAEPDAYGVVWFDMCGVDFGQFDVQTLLHCAKHKFFTLSCRQIICSSQQDALCHQLVQAKERIIEKSLYTGVSGRALNMVFVASKSTPHSSVIKPLATTAVDTSPECDGIYTLQGRPLRVGVGIVVKFPILFWKTQDFIKEYNFKVFDDEYIIGAVHSQVSNSASMFRLSFQLIGGGTMLCGRKYSLDTIMKYAM